MPTTAERSSPRPSSPLALLPASGPTRPYSLTTIVLALALLHTLWNLLGLGSDHARELVGDFAFVLFGIGGAGVAWRRAQSSRAPRLRRGWRFLAAGLLAYGLGNAVFAYLELVLGEPTFPSLADGFFALFPPLITIGVILLSGPPLNRRERLYLLLDSAIVLTSGLVIAWLFMGRST